MSYLLALLIIGITILFHEFGHLVFAKMIKMPINIFSVGFGPKLLSKKIGKTEYRLSMIPLGGYVMPAIEDEKEFFEIPVYKRAIMSIGGPIASIILPIFCFSLINTFTMDFSLWALTVKPILQAGQLFIGMAASLPQIFSGQGEVAGIVGIISQGGQIIESSIFNSLKFAALISLNFALLNLLPLPILDGGKILLYLMEKVSVKFKKVHYPLALASWVLIIGLMVYVTVLDVSKLIA